MELRERAIALRREGHSFYEIGRRLGISHQRSCKVVNEYLNNLKETCVQSTEQLRQIELEKLDRLESLLNQQLADPLRLQSRDYHRAIELLLKTQQQRARLLGLVIPTQVLVPVPDTSHTSRVETVMGDPRVAEIVTEAHDWEPPRLAIAEPAEDSQGVV